MPQRIQPPFFMSIIYKWSVTSPCTLEVLHYLPALEFICYKFARWKLSDAWMYWCYSSVARESSWFGVLGKNKNVSWTAVKRGGEASWSISKLAVLQLVAPTGLWQFLPNLSSGIRPHNSCVSSLNPWKNRTLFKTRGIVSPSGQRGDSASWLDEEEYLELITKFNFLP